jgi:hypothetical protein
MTDTPKQSPSSTDQGTTTQPPSSDDNNKPTKSKLPKGDDLLGGQELAIRRASICIVPPAIPCYRRIAH